MAKAEKLQIIVDGRYKANRSAFFDFVVYKTERVKLRSDSYVRQ